MFSRTVSGSPQSEHSPSRLANSQAHAWWVMTYSVLIVRQYAKSMQLDVLPRLRHGSILNLSQGFHSPQVRQMRPASLSWDRARRAAITVSRPTRFIVAIGTNARQVVLPCNRLANQRAFTVPHPQHRHSNRRL